jgi:hypothetical protein
LIVTDLFREVRDFLDKEQRPKKRDAEEQGQGPAGDPQRTLDGELWADALAHFTEEQQANINAFEKRMRSMTKGRSLFAPLHGFVGLGPCSTLRKDTDWGKDCLYEVHVIKGAKVPYVLARYPNGTYRLIGEAFVYGIMDGVIAKIALELERKGKVGYERIRLV